MPVLGEHNSSKTILHLVSQRCGERSFLDYLGTHILGTDGLLLLGNGVFNLIDPSWQETLSGLKAQGVRCYAIAPDITGRGLERSSFDSQLDLIDYEQFVALTLQYSMTRSL